MTVKPEDPLMGVEGAGYGQETVFPHTLESVGVARRILDDDLRRRSVARSAADDAVLILSELVSNALRHARPLSGGTIRVAWWTEDSRVLRIAVTDGGGVGGSESRLEAAELDEVDESAVEGRGLGIVGVLADEWGVEQAAEGGPGAGKTVWAAIRIHARHAGAVERDESRKTRVHRLRFARRVRAALWPGGSRGGEGEGSAAWAPRHPQVRLVAVPVGR